MTDAPETDAATADTADLGPAPVVTDLDTRRISDALTGWAQAAIDHVLASLALAEQRWKVTARAWVRAAGKPWPPGHLRLDLRAVATRGDDEDGMTEEHHSILDLTGIAADLKNGDAHGAAGMVAGTMQTALAQLAELVAPPLRARLVREGVLERPASVIGAGVLVHPSCPHADADLGPGAIKRQCRCGHVLLVDMETGRPIRR